MKIIFLCGSLEPGHDGVGDYTRRLAAELIAQGHDVRIVAIADKHVQKTTRESQIENDISINVVRIPIFLSYASRLPVVKKLIAIEKPDWLSLQFVIFSYHPKGIPIGLRKFLFEIGKKQRWHIMFHELWLGMEQNTTLKHKLWGAIQLKLVKSIISKLKPQVVHTQAKVYQYRLLKLGLTPKLLPLFPNISVNNNSDKNFVQEHANHEKRLSLIMFGTIHPGGAVKEFVEDLNRYGQDSGVPIRLTVVGRTGKEERNWVEACTATGIEVIVKGEQPGEVVSDLMQLSDIGITTYPVSLIDKSGTVAAMLAHGLPVVSVSKPWKPRWNIIPTLMNVIEYKPGNLHACFQYKKQRHTPDILKSTAKQMMMDLELTVEADNIYTA
ncbi:glycosyltransferase family 4 protein [Flavisolibacter sp. BT320]|nr:glycosyltransferase family 4 protein [Flavisolibacter longurius]